MISSIWGARSGNCSQIFVRSERWTEDFSLVFCDPENLCSGISCALNKGSMQFRYKPFLEHLGGYGKSTTDIRSSFLTSKSRVSGGGATIVVNSRRRVTLQPWAHRPPLFSASSADATSPLQAHPPSFNHDSPPQPLYPPQSCQNTGNPPYVPFPLTPPR